MVYTAMGTINTPTGTESVEYYYNIYDGACHIGYMKDGVETPLPSTYFKSWAETPDMWSGVDRTFDIASTCIDEDLNNSYLAFKNLVNTFASTGLYDTAANCAALVDRVGIENYDGTFRDTKVYGEYTMQAVHKNMPNMFKNTDLTKVTVSNALCSGMYDMKYAFDSCSKLTNISFGGTFAGATYNLDYAFNNCRNVVNLDKTGTHKVSSGNHAFENLGVMSEDTFETTAKGAWTGAWDIVGSADSMFENSHVFTNQGVFNFSDPLTCTGRNLLRNANVNICGSWSSTCMVRVNNCRDLSNYMTDAAKTYQRTGYQHAFCWLNKCSNMYSAYTNAFVHGVSPRIIFEYFDYLTDMRYMFNNTYGGSGTSWANYPLAFFRDMSDIKNFPNYKEEAKDCLTTWSTNIAATGAVPTCIVIDGASAIVSNLVRSQETSGTARDGVVATGVGWEKWTGSSGAKGTGTVAPFYGGERAYHWQYPGTSAYVDRGCQALWY